MSFAPSFEYGRDISLLSGALRSAERSLQKQDPELTLCCVDRERSEALALAISTGIQSAYKTSADHSVIHSRIHCSLFANALWSSGIVDRSELDYFESVLDNFPQVGWNLFLTLVDVCNWRQCYIACVQGLSLETRLPVLKAAMEFAEDSPYIWSCAFSALWWSACIEPHLCSEPNSDDDTLNALSRLRPADPVDESKLDPLAFLQSSAKRLLEMGSPSDDLGNSSAVPKQVTPLLSVLNDFLTQAFERSEARVPPSDDWLADGSDAADEITDDFYTTRRPEWTTRFPTDVLRSELRASEDVIRAAVCVLDSDDVSDMLARERDAHKYCVADGVCANGLTAVPAGKNRSNAFETLGEPSPFHAAGRLKHAVEVVSELTNSAALDELRRLVSGWDGRAARDMPQEVCERLVDSVVQSLEGRESCQRAELITWILSHVDLTKEQRIIDSLKKHLVLLSHPRLFPPLVQAAEKAGDVDALKGLILDVCNAAPLQLQRAMLSYVISEARENLSLRLSSFPGQLTQRLNLICDTEGGSDALDGLTSLCLQSPSEVVRRLVDLAVTDGCATLVCQASPIISFFLHFLGPACKQRNDATGQSLLAESLGRHFRQLLERPSKQSVQYVSLLGELCRAPDLLDWDAFRLQIVPYLEQGGARDPAPDEFFPIRVLMAVRSRISAKHHLPTAQLLIQILDSACTQLNGARKERLLDFLDTYLTEILDPCGASYEDKHWKLLEQAAEGCSGSCRAAVCQMLGKRKLEDSRLYKAVWSATSNEPLLFNAERWNAECAKLSAEHHGQPLEELTLPHFAQWFAGATWDEWEMLLERVDSTLRLGEDGPVTTVDVIQFLALCLAGCKRFLSVGNWSHLFSCFARAVRTFLQREEEPIDKDVCTVLEELLFCLFLVPEQCRRQGVVLLLDAVQLLQSAELKEGLSELLVGTLTTQESAPKAFSAAVDCLVRSFRDKLSSRGS
ncbi:unnamed protein product [Ixodes hexagonus]